MQQTEQWADTDARNQIAQHRPEFQSRGDWNRNNSGAQENKGKKQKIGHVTGSDYLAFEAI